jgi:hypothetical protein
MYFFFLGPGITVTKDNLNLHCASSQHKEEEEEEETSEGGGPDEYVQENRPHMVKSIC